MFTESSVEPVYINAHQFTTEYIDLLLNTSRHIHIYTHTHTCIHVYIDMFHVYICMYVYGREREGGRKGVREGGRERGRGAAGVARRVGSAYVYASNICIHMHTRTHKHTHTHTHTHTNTAAKQGAGGIARHVSNGVISICKRTHSAI